MTNAGRAWFEDIAGRDPDHERVYRVHEDDEYGFLIGRVVDLTCYTCLDKDVPTPGWAIRYEAQPFDRTRYQPGPKFDRREDAIRWLIDRHVFPPTRNPFARHEPEPERPPAPPRDKPPPDQGSLF